MLFLYGSVRTLTDAHTLVDEQFCLLYPDILPDRNHDRLFAEFAARVLLYLLPGRGEEREALLQHSSCILYYWLFCAATIYVRSMVHTPSTLFLYCSTAQ